MGYLGYVKNLKSYEAGEVKTIEGVLSKYAVRNRGKEVFKVSGVTFRNRTLSGGHYLKTYSQNKYLREGVYVYIKYTDVESGIVHMKVYSDKQIKKARPLSRRS